MQNKSYTEKDLSPPIKCTAPWRLTHVKALEEYILEVTFTDGAHGFVDMRYFIHQENAGVFKALRDKNIFNQVHVYFGAPTWPGEIDLAPDTLHALVLISPHCTLR